jgi:hypothetical protein
LPQFVGELRVNPDALIVFHPKTIRHGRIRAMTIMTKLLAGAAGAAAIATAVPASAQYPYAYAQPYNGYAQSYSGYAQPYRGYSNAYGAYGMNTQAAAQQCTAAVQNRLYTRTGLSSIITSLFGMSGTSARVLSVTDVRPSRSSIRVRGLATSGRYAYNQYGSGYYGAAAAGYTPDLSFRCDVDLNGYVRNVDINRL